MNDIVCYGKDGSELEYHAVRGNDFTPDEIGWVLRIDGTEEPLSPQAVTALDVVGDLTSMGIERDAALAQVGAFTEEMRLVTAGRGRRERATSGEPSPDWDQCSERLQLELEELATLALVRDGTEPDYSGPDGERLRWTERALSVSRAWVARERDDARIDGAFSRPHTLDHDHSIDLLAECVRAERTVEALEAERETILARQALRRGAATREDGAG